MTPTIVFDEILERAGLQKKYRDPRDGRTVYVTKTKPADFRPAMIEWEKTE